MSYLKGDKMGALKGIFGIVKKATGSDSKADEYARQTRTSSADVISWSGCKDDQTSADTQEAGESTGAMSYVSRTSMLWHHEDLRVNNLLYPRRSSKLFVRPFPSFLSAAGLLILWLPW